MAYDDGYYYGQCKIVAVVDNTADNGKTVLITTDDNKTYSGTIANKKCEFLLPPRTLYTVQKVSSGSTEFTTKVEAGYGDCILVHLDTGYIDVKQGDIVGLDYIKAATDDKLKNKVPEAKAVKELNNSFGGVQFGIDGEGNRCYLGADGSLIPFKGNQADLIPYPYVLNTRLHNGNGSFSLIDDKYIRLKFTDNKTDLTAHEGLRSYVLIDFSKYTKLSIKYNYTTTNTKFTFAVWAWTTGVSGKTSGWSDTIAAIHRQEGDKNFLRVNESKEEKIVIDISDFNTTAYLYINMSSQSNPNTGTGEVLIYEIKLLK